MKLSIKTKRDQEVTQSKFIEILSLSQAFARELKTRCNIDIETTLKIDTK